MEVNPYESPQIPVEASSESPTPWLVTYSLFMATSMLVSGVLGIVMNAFHAWYCPEYFEIVMHWDSANDTWLRAIFQGGLEGSLFGLLLSIFHIMVAWRITKGRITYVRAASGFFSILPGAVAMSIFFGDIAYLLVDGQWPIVLEIFSRTPDPLVMRRFAYVSASIPGLEIGAVIFSIYVLWILWRRTRDEMTAQSAAAKQPVAD
jgi:hypothetical protein